MKYLSVFATESAYAAAKLDGTFARPHVSLVEETSSVKFDPVMVADPEQTPGEGPDLGDPEQKDDFEIGQM